MKYFQPQNMFNNGKFPLVLSKLRVTAITVIPGLLDPRRVRPLPGRIFLIKWNSTSVGSFRWQGV